MLNKINEQPLSQETILVDNDRVHATLFVRL